jgi:hypothetical protein
LRASECGSIVLEVQIELGCGENIGVRRSALCGLHTARICCVTDKLWIEPCGENINFGAKVELAKLDQYIGTTMSNASESDEVQKPHLLYIKMPSALDRKRLQQASITFARLI